MATYITVLGKKIKINDGMLFRFLKKKWKKLKYRCCCWRKNQVVTSDVELPRQSVEEASDYEKYMKAEYLKPVLADFTLSEYTEKGEIVTAVSKYL